LLGAASLSLPEMVRASTGKTVEKSPAPTLRLGVASYTLREFSTEEALDMTLRCGVDRITLKSMHLPLEADTETIHQVVALCKGKGITLYGAGVVYMKDKADVDQAFAYAKTAGMEMIIGVPTHELLDHVEEKVKESGIKLAIHNHGPGDQLYSSPEDAYRKVTDRHPDMGLCVDIGHAQRIGRDPAQDVAEFSDRVFDIHLKDVTASAPDGETCIIGRGVIDFPNFLKTVKNIGYSGTLALEYEAEAKDPLPGMTESLGYVKGILSTL